MINSCVGMGNGDVMTVQTLPKFRELILHFTKNNAHYTLYTNEIGN